MAKYDKQAATVTPAVIESPVVETPAVETPVNDTTVISGSVATDTTAPVGEVATVAEVAAVVEEKVVASVGYVLSEASQKLVNRVKDTGNHIAVDAIDSVLKYMSDMAPGKTMPAEEGGLHQIVLFRAIRSIIEFTGEEFQLSFVTLLRLFDEFGEGVFAERYVFRFMDTVSLTPDDRKAFERIVNLIKIAAPVAGRKEAMRQVSLAKAMQYSFTEEGKRTVMNFFNL